MPENIAKTTLQRVFSREFAFRGARRIFDVFELAVHRATI
jgi:hypothetical protein